MNLTRYSIGLATCAVLVACGSNAPQPAVAPAEPAVAPAPQVSLDSAVDRYSYALGMDLGKAIANINVPVKMDVLMLAIQDEVDPARKSLLSDSASESALQDLLLRMQKQKEDDEKAAAAKALEDQAAFLAKNIQDSTVKVTPKGVQYRVLKAGTGISPKVTDKVQVHYIGAFAMDLGQLDYLVFTAGIGEHSAFVRKRVCEKLGLLGVKLNEDRNERNETEISAEDSHVKVLVIPTNEELGIARRTYEYPAGKDTE